MHPLVSFTLGVVVATTLSFAVGAHADEPPAPTQCTFEKNWGAPKGAERVQQWMDLQRANGKSQFMPFGTGIVCAW
jgi:hypothetical protein